MIVCPSCGEENPERARFCLACAAPLGAAAPRNGAEERKIVSILFVDLVGHTARSDRADPEDVRARLRPYHARVKQEIERFGGTVEKFVGDAVMAVFGAPVAHEDDAERAVRAGLRILEATAELGVEVRAAVNTGEAVVALGAHPEQGEGIVTGDVVNTASRLQGVAPVGGLVVGEACFRSTRNLVEYEELAPVVVKGKAEAIPLWLAKEARSRFGVDVEQPAAAAFVGRDDDLALLRQTWTRTLREESLQLVTVTGEPGVGKSRLVSEFRQFVDDRPELVVWRQGRCIPYGEGITFWALGEMVKAHAGILESDGTDEAAAKLARMVESLTDESERDWLHARLAPLVGLETQGEAAPREESFTAWRGFLERIAAERPLVLVFEDLHWADAPLLEFVGHLADWASGVPLLVLCTARPELFERAPGWAGGKRNSTTVSLSPLSADDTARLVADLLAQAVLPAETQAALLERAGGNPLYAEEFVRMLTDRELLTPHGAFAAGAGIAVPETVQAVIAARLDTLAPERKALLHDASVLGKIFWEGALAAMGGVEEAGVHAGLHDLARKELVRPARTSSVEHEAEYSFWHALVRDVAYAQIPRAARARKHQAAAGWIEQVAGERVTDHAELLAHHYGEALRLLREAGEDAEAAALEEPALRFLVLAGDRAEQLDLGRARDLYLTALGLAQPGDPRRPEILVKLAKTQWLSGGFEDGQAYAREGVEGLLAAGDRRRAGEATLWYAGALSHQGKTAETGAAVTRAIELLEAESPGKELAFAYAFRAAKFMLAGDGARALEWAERSLRVSRETSTEEHPLARQCRGFGRCDRGDWGGLDDLRLAATRALEADNALETVIAHTNLAHLTWLSEGPAAAVAVSRTGLAVAAQRGVRGPGMWGKAENLWRLFDLGDWDELLADAEGVLDWDRAEGGQAGVIALPYKAQVLLRRGRLAETKGFAEEYLPRAREAQDGQVLAPALSTAALTAWARGDRAEALARLRELVEATRGVVPSVAILLPDAVLTAVRAGEPSLGEALLPDRDPPDRRTQYAVVSARAVLAEAGGGKAEALELYGQAAERWAEFPSVLEHGQALLGVGRCRLALGLAADSAGRDARELFAGLGAHPLVAEADALLAEATALSS